MVRRIWALFICARCGLEQRVYVRVDERITHACPLRSK